MYHSFESLKGAHMKVGKDESSNDLEVVLVYPSSRICSPLAIGGLPMYDIVFTIMCVTLPFSDFEVNVLNHLKIGPS
jgi:hypothetical protein